MSKIIKEKDTRRIFVETLNELAEKDPNIIVIICDVGFNYLDDPKNKFRVLNLGITEQSSMIIASALALSGFKVYIYSMINFMVFRPYEMVRNAVCYHNADVTIIGVKGSERYKFLGFSHNITEDEDIKVLKHLPNMRIFNPQKPDDVRKTVLDSYKIKGPAYIRL